MEKKDIQAIETNFEAVKNILSKEEINFYSRQMILPEISLFGQMSLKSAKVLCIGAGGIGSPCLMYLCGSGVGTIGMMDGDIVESSNLHRQVLHNTAKLGMSKVQSAYEHLKLYNPHVKLELHNERITQTNARKIIKDYDIILDGSDNAITRYLVNDACVLEDKPQVSGSSVKWAGQLTVYNFKNGPCYRCIWPECPKASQMQSCSDNGVVGMCPGAIGVLMALECVKVILGMDEGVLSGRFVMLDGKDATFKTANLRKKQKNCKICSYESMETFDIEKFDYDLFTGQHTADYICATNKTFYENIDLSKVKSVTWNNVLNDTDKNDYLLQDVRPETQYEIIHFKPKGFQTVHIAWSELKNMDQKDLEEELTQEGKKTVFCFCRKGVESLIATAYLNKIGFENCHTIEGGLLSYCEDVDDTIPNLA